MRAGACRASATAADADPAHMHLSEEKDQAEAQDPPCSPASRRPRACESPSQHPETHADFPRFYSTPAPPRTKGRRGREGYSLRAQRGLPPKGKKKFQRMEHELQLPPDWQVSAAQRENFITEVAMIVVAAPHICNFVWLLLLRSSHGILHFSKVLRK